MATEVSYKVMKGQKTATHRLICSVMKNIVFGKPAEDARFKCWWYRFVAHGLLCVMLLLAVPASFAGEEGMTLTIEEVKSKYTADLMALPGVVSVGIGRDRDGQLAIMVGLDGSHPEVVDKIPQELESYPVITHVIGPVKAR